MAYARQDARRAASAVAAAVSVRNINDPCSPALDVELSAAHAPEYMGAAILSGLNSQHTWWSHRCTCHMHQTTAVARKQRKQIGYHARRTRASATAPLHLHFVRPASAPTRAAPVTVGGAANSVGKDVRMGMSASALTRRGLRQPSHVLYAWSASRTGTPYSRQLRCWRPELLSARTPLARCNHVHVQYCILGGCKCKCKYFTSHIHIGL